MISDECFSLPRSMKPLRPLTSWRPRESSCWVLLEILRALSTTGCSPSAETSRLVHPPWPHAAPICHLVSVQIPPCLDAGQCQCSRHPECCVLKCHTHTHTHNVLMVKFQFSESVTVLLFCVNFQQLREKSFRDNRKRKCVFLTWNQSHEDFMLCDWAYLNKRKNVTYYQKQNISFKLSSDVLKLKCGLCKGHKSGFKSGVSCGQRASSHHAQWKHAPCAAHSGVTQDGRVQIERETFHNMSAWMHAPPPAD